LISVSKNIGKFNADPAFGSFRAWLLAVARWRIVDQLRKRDPGRDSPLGGRHGSNETQSGTAPQERIADPNGNQFEAIWDEEERSTLVDRALDKLKREVRPEHFQIFHLYAIKGLSAATVSQQLGASRFNIYQVYRRLKRLFDKAREQLGDELG
jgi:RNA polymerase sigma factor (sigma-70 family)